MSRTSAASLACLGLAFTLLSGHRSAAAPANEAGVPRAEVTPLSLPGSEPFVLRKVNGVELRLQMFHATGDTTVLCTNSVVLRDKLAASGNRCELVTFEGLSHSYNSIKSGEAGKAADKRTREDVIAFLPSLKLLAPAGGADSSGK